MTEQLTHDDLIDRIKARYNNTWGYLFLPSVRDATGHVSSRTVDLLVLGLFQSRGYDLTGFEVKASRGDWLTELRKPEKAESVFPFCHRWYVVANKGVVKKEEVPKPWGLMVAYGKTLRAVKPAPELDATPMDIPFLASVLTHMQKHTASGRNIEEVKQIAFEQGRASAENRHKVDWELAVKRQEEMKLFIDTFEAKSGVHIDRYDSGKIAVAVKAVLGAEIDPHVIRQARREVEVAKQNLTTAQTALAELERVMTTRREGEKDGRD